MLDADIGILLLRLLAGLIMVFHGTQKLFGWWGGEGLAGAARFFERQGFRPPRAMAIAAATLETLGGVLLATGLLSLLAVLILASTLVNVFLIHLKNGLDRRKGGFEYELLLLGAVACIAFTGPAAFSLDSLLGLSIASLVVGVIGIQVPSTLLSLGFLVAGLAGGSLVAVTRSKPSSSESGRKASA